MIASTIVVTVTYGQREHLLRQVLDSLSEQGVTRVVVVDNGSQWPVAETLRSDFGEFVEVVTMGHNTGSAGGFKAGIARAMELQTEFIWVLDDDNRPECGALSTLLQEFTRQAGLMRTELLALCAHRSTGNEGISPVKMIPRHSSYSGFHILDISRKIAKRTPLRNYLKDRIKFPIICQLPVAPYGGLLFRSSLLSIVGFPNDDFILYYDDYECTNRIARIGGVILHISTAIVKNLQGKLGSTHSDLFVALLCG